MAISTLTVWGGVLLMEEIKIGFQDVVFLTSQACFASFLEILVEDLGLLVCHRSVNCSIG